jgi:hypothetical protein
MSRNVLFYLAVLLVCGAGIWLILDQGSHLQATAAATTGEAASPEHPAGPAAASGGGLGALVGNLRHPLSMLLLQVLVIVGLRTQIGLLNDWQSWAMCLGIIVVAIAGKLGGSMAAARWTGMSWSDSFSLGALMNTRGLVELIVLNIGFDLGILSPRIFAMLVLMALVTTFMTGPLVSLVEWQRRRATDLGSRPETVV